MNAKTNTCKFGKVQGIHLHGVKVSVYKLLINHKGKIIITQ